MDKRTFMANVFLLEDQGPRNSSAWVYGQLSMMGRNLRLKINILPLDMPFAILASLGS
jgi:hypothetical protein